MDIKELGSLVKGHVIMHHPHGSVISDGNTVEEYVLLKNCTYLMLMFLEQVITLHLVSSNL